MNDRELSIQYAYKRGVKDGIAKAQKDDDDAFWLRQYAGYALQGILASGYVLSDDLVIATRAVTQAKALLEEVKKHDQTR